MGNRSQSNTLLLDIRKYHRGFRYFLISYKHIAPAYSSLVFLGSIVSTFRQNCGFYTVSFYSAHQEWINHDARSGCDYDIRSMLPGKFVVAFYRKEPPFYTNHKFWRPPMARGYISSSIHDAEQSSLKNRRSLKPRPIDILDSSVSAVMRAVR